jgi:glucokinase
LKKKKVAIGRPSVLRRTNALYVLELLREFGACSRADLVRASGLSAPTVTNIVKDLLFAGLVEPLGEGESNGGRPPDMLRFRAERGCVAAVDLSAERISILIADLDGNELIACSISLSGSATAPAVICRYIDTALGNLMRKKKLSRSELLVLVVAVPAIANVSDGIVLSISTLDGWRSVPLASMLHELVHCLVIVENDTNLAAQGERYRGAALGERDFVFISIGPNVSAGIILDGKIHHGSQWSAGEIAYLRLPGTSRRHPTIHQFGELEGLLTTSAILASWHDLNKTAPTSKKRSAKRLDATEVLNLAQAGDAQAKAIVDQRSTIVADIIVNLSLILNPDLILLGGEVGSHPALIRSVQKQLEGSEFGVTRVGAGSLGDSAILWGAVLTALEVIPTVLLPQAPS